MTVDAADGGLDAMVRVARQRRRALDDQTVVLVLALHAAGDLCGAICAVTGIGGCSVEEVRDALRVMRSTVVRWGNRKTEPAAHARDGHVARLVEHVRHRTDAAPLAVPVLVRE